MRNTGLTLAMGECVLSICLTCACSTQIKTSNQQYHNPAVVYAQAGQAVKEVVDSLPPSGGTVALGAGVWASGYNSGECISKPNITIRGSGRPAFNFAFTAMVGGTIVLGRLPACTGADYFTVRDLGVDAGPVYITGSNGGVPTDALAIYNSGEVIGAPQVESPAVDNVACLGFSTTAAVHCMLMENVNHALIHNVVTAMNQHGLVIKGTNSTVDGVVASGHGIASVLVKSEDYAPASQNHLSNITIQPLLVGGDTRGISIVGVTAPVSDITVSHARILSPLAWGINVRGSNYAAGAANLNFLDISIDYPGGSPTDEFCMQFVNYVSNVQINALNCFDMWAGVRSYLPAPNAFDDFTVRSSYFENIASDAVQTYGSWQVFDSRFEAIAGNGIVNSDGITTVYENTFIDINGSDMLRAGGTFVFSSSLSLAEQITRSIRSH